MTAAAGVVRLEEHLVPEAAHALARAFYADPMWRWIEPEMARREKALEWAMGKIVRYGMLFGEVYAPEGRAVGAAVWLPPSLASDPDPDGTRSGFAQAETHMGADAWGRWSRCMSHLHGLRRAQRPHWYLMLLGVDPARQRGGIAASLLAPVLERADAQHEACYLETERRQNVAYYQKHGFALASDGTFEDLRYWTMRREPRGA